MTKKIKIKINGQECKCSSESTILEAAMKNKVFIPNLCYHSDFKPKANCRICVVEIAGEKKLVTSCSTKVREGMEVFTNTDRVKKARNMNIEFLFAEHIEKCPECIWRVNCKLLDLADRYKLNIYRFKDRKRDRKTYKFGNAVEIDGSQCIDCGNCIEACSVIQDINYLEMKGKGIHQEVVPTSDKKINCIYCGQCAVHCPVGAAQEQGHWQIVEDLLNKKDRKFAKNKIVVAQFAPSIRVSIGEEFAMPYGKIVTEQLVTGLKELGFDYAFDVNFGADVTTVVEAEELIERLKAASSKARRSKSETKVALPMMTSCCPGWVNYVEFYHPELIPNLTTSRSPHIHLGGIIKTYWAKAMKVKPENIVVVSIMPCTAKKFECQRSEMKISGLLPVDYTITTREFAWLMKKKRINFSKLKPTKSDNPLGEYSGAAAIYGGSGGVMESALRTAHAKLCANKKTGVCLPKIDFQEVRGIEGYKEAQVNVGGVDLNIAVINGMKNFKKLYENLDKYQYVEVMACPGGCIGGGGQPYPTTDEIRKKRVAALYKIDKGQKLRKAHENKGVLEVLDWLKKQDMEHKVLHTHYKKRVRK